MEAIKEQCRVYQEQMLANHMITATISVGSVCSGLENVKKSYRDAVQALKYKFILGHDAVILNNEMSCGVSQKPIEFEYARYLQNSIRARNLSETIQILQELKYYLKSNLSPGSDFVYYYRDVIKLLGSYLQEAGTNHEHQAELLQQVFMDFENRFENIDEATEWIIRFIEEWFTEMKNEEISMNHLVRKVICIIKQEYDRDLSLNELADRFSVSLSYLSRLCKEEMGRNFKEYLIEYRIAKAKELLQGSSLSINEIAARVGYFNAMQFSRIFKKYEHITPMEYRDTAR